MTAATTNPTNAYTVPRFQQPGQCAGESVGRVHHPRQGAVVAMTGSYFRGDSARVEADLCQQCVKELIGPFCHVLPAQD